jgi:uncharacterized membrane protein YccC
MRNNVLRRISSILVAILLGSVFEYYFSMAHDFIIPVTAVFVMLTSVGNLIYQGMIRFVLMIVFVIMLSLIFPPWHLVYGRVYDVCIGASLGIVINLIILPRHADVEFRAALLPVLQIYKEYFTAIISLLLDKNKTLVESKKILLEAQLQALPQWVYSRGFDSGLRKGHQYFLMKTYHLAEILFAMHNYARFNYDSELLDGMRDTVKICEEKVTHFLESLVAVFELKKLTEAVDDFAQDLRELDGKFQSLLPVSADLLDMSQEDSNFYAFIYDLQDLRNTLIKLAQSLR